MKSTIVRNTAKFLLAVTFVVSPTLCLSAAGEAFVFGNEDSARIQFAVDELKDALAEREMQVSFKPLSQANELSDGARNIVLVNTAESDGSTTVPYPRVEALDEVSSEGFVIHRAPEAAGTVWVLGPDDAGVMYGGLEVAEIIRLHGWDAVENQSQSPHMKLRGTKFNIPLDVRTPTYTEPSDAAQKNMAEMWNFEFWRDYIDHLARYRYNTISLWNMHPFPSMVKVPEYPDVALDDVRQSTVDWKEFYSLHGREFGLPEIVDNYEVIKEMTIYEKIDFWRKVMAYGKDRNIRFFIVTWNIFDYGVDGKYGITDELENPITTDYFRASIREMFFTYPDLAGMGLTTGENMYAYTATQKEEWAFATYGRGILDVVEAQPDRQITLIHREHESEASEIRAIFAEAIQHENIHFVFSFKYAQAHVYSSDVQTFHLDFVEDIQSENLRTMWTLRNDDIYHFRWGAPDFVRAFIRNIPHDVSEGFYYGSDQWVWGREFLGRNSSEPRELEVAKHWHRFKLWGRLGYNPDLGNERFIGMIENRFPEVDSREMFDAWQSASMIYPLVTGFHWGRLDFQWYIESGQSHPRPANTPSGYHDVNRFITLPPHPDTDNISIPDYTRAYLSNTPVEGTTPLELADEVLAKADFALAWAKEKEMGLPRELRLTIDDIQTIAYMGKYYGHKIRAATYLDLFRRSTERKWYEKVLEELNTSAAYFRRYATLAKSNYHNPLWTNRVGHVDWKENFAWALYDITANGGNPQMPSMDATPGGTILDVTDAEFEVSQLRSHIRGYTGEGFLETGNWNAHHQVTWTFNAPKAGQYILEFRYTLAQQATYPSPVVVNGKEVGEIEFWMTGNRGAWVWERVTVDLEEGGNTIFISPMGRVNLDHLNIIQLHSM